MRRLVLIGAVFALTGCETIGVVADKAEIVAPRVAAGLTAAGINIISFRDESGALYEVTEEQALKGTLMCVALADMARVTGMLERDWAAWCEFGAKAAAE